MNKDPNTIARRGLMFVLSSPSGAGKSTISKALLECDGGITMSFDSHIESMRRQKVRDHRREPRVVFDEKDAVVLWFLFH